MSSTNGRAKLSIVNISAHSDRITATATYTGACLFASSPDSSNIADIPLIMHCFEITDLICLTVFKVSFDALAPLYLIIISVLLPSFE